MTKKKLDEIMAANGRSCTMEPPADQSTWNNILRQLGTVYTGSALEALKEYVTNSIDAGATDIHVRLKRRGNKLSVAVDDNGNGMFLPEEEAELMHQSASDFSELELAADSILRLPKKIGDSAKKLDQSTQGNKAIGALAWQTIGQNVSFVSKKEDLPTVGWSCTYSKTGEGNHHYESNFVEEKDVSELAEIRNSKGTTVTIGGVSRTVIRELNPAIVQNDFGSRFRDPIKSGQVSITIHDERGEYKVVAEEYQGKPVIVEEVQTEFGPMFIEIYANPHKKGKLTLKQGIQTLVDDMGARYLDSLESEAWGSGILTGQVRADWVNPAGGRQEMENDERREAFMGVLRKYNGRVEEVVQKYKEANDPVQRRRFYTSMSRAFAKMIEEDPLLEEILNGRRCTKRGEETPGQPGEGFAIPAGGPGGGTGETEPGEPRKDHKKYENPDLGKPVDHTKEGTTKSRKSVTLRFNDEPFSNNPEVLSRFEEEYSMIVFNSAAPTYIRAMENVQTKKMYHTALIGKELYGRIETDPRKLTDMVIDFQQRFMDYFNL